MPVAPSRNTPVQQTLRCDLTGFPPTASWAVGTLEGPMFSSSIPLGRLAGAPLRLHWSAVVVGVLIGATLVADVGVVVAVVRDRVASSPRSSVTRRPTPTSPAATASPRRRSTCGRSAAWPASSASRARARAEGWIAAAGPLASLAIGAVGIGAAFALRALDAPFEVTARRLGRRRQRHPRRLQPAARRPARRRPHRARRALGSPRQPLPGDARGRPGRRRDRLGARRRSGSG